MGAAVIALAVGLWLLRRSHSWREGLLLCWAITPVAFFEILAGQGIPVPAGRRACRRAAGSPRRAPDSDPPADSVAACRSPRGDRRRGRRRRGQPRRAELVRGQPGADHDVPRGLRRPARNGGEWAAGSSTSCCPQGAPADGRRPLHRQHRPVLRAPSRTQLSVGPNPFRATRPRANDNPDRELRRGTIQYAVWDLVRPPRAARRSSPTGSCAARRQVTTASPVHTETIAIRLADGAEVGEAHHDRL